MLDHTPLEAVYIFFDTATYDEIERDQKVALLNTTCCNDKNELKQRVKIGLLLLLVLV